MTAITETLSVSTSTVIRKLKEFEFKSDLNHLPEHMSWYEYSFKKGKMSFIAHDYDTRKIVAILDGRTQATIRNHFLRYSRQVRCRVKVITIDMFSPYYDIARKLFQIQNHSRLLSHCPASQSSNESRMHTNYESV